MDIKDKAKFLIQRTANSLGYEIHRVPDITTTLTPPSYLRSLVGSRSSVEAYEAQGLEFFNYFKDLCSLKPDEDVLDVGCGCGRMAVQLTKYMKSSAAYEGFDIDLALVGWCQKNISSRYPNFHFQLVDRHNKSKISKGQLKAPAHRFPYNDESFDFVFLTSVFTHMLPRDMEVYLAEISRVLRKGQRCLITFFLLNAESSALVDAKLSTQDFSHVFKNYSTISKSSPEDAVAYAEDYILGLYGKYGLEIANPIRYGSWCGRGRYLSYQDIIIAVKA